MMTVNMENWKKFVQFKTDGRPRTPEEFLKMDVDQAILERAKLLLDKEDLEIFPGSACGTPWLELDERWTMFKKRWHQLMIVEVK